MPYRAVAVMALAGLLANPALASAQDNCLNREQRHAAVASKKVIPLATALRAAQGRRSELVNARLCNGPQGLYYLLTLLPRDGKVRRAAVDAATGKLAEAR